ncbi:MAG TPA: deoxyguanosinetriphosphate triphosphohydrolase, partial [Alphaproteobacteria bacterium]|nr:deoxyguanosinetriphosphate triphosphohydrolase [Alphaproteobacteria bacterium]
MMFDRSLAPYASNWRESRGRLWPEAESSERTSYMRDRDRIVHSGAFRRLKYKTQVFVYHEGDHYRTRLTHTIEVAQISRTIARRLGLDEDLAEALALAHDVGHPPFGHAGEDSLNECMDDYGGFDHNLQTLRVVMFLENKYLKYSG